MILTKTMRERKQYMEEISDAFIVAPGGIGTLDEFFEIFTLQNLDQHRKPIALFNVNGFYEPMLTMLEALVEKGFLSPKAVSRLIVTDDIRVMLEKIKNFKYE